MLWKGRRESGNIVDQRFSGGKAVGGAGLLIGAVVVYLLGGNPLDYIANHASSGGGSTSYSTQGEAQDTDRKSFASVVLADTEDVWRDLFQDAGHQYVDPKLVLFRGTVSSACGRATKASGPFYCPGDQRVYLDLSFFDELSEKLGARGDFAGAYVIAHEVGHHVQNLLGLERGARSNAASVQIELQADCLAGVWAKQTSQAKNVIENGDLDEAIGAASAVGDDRLQKRSQGTVVPDSFTHGSSAQRVQAFQRGFEGASLAACGAR